ncbi:hypothetical protein B0H19DRAFT_1245265 [Mycena capillaripes]|nr:hypothetical protein B0H19DRAFT_1245265 [Mycena capillaripes]
MASPPPASRLSYVISASNPLPTSSARHLSTSATSASLNLATAFISSAPRSPSDLANSSINAACANASGVPALTAEYLNQFSWFEDDLPCALPQYLAVEHLFPARCIRHPPCVSVQ